MTPSAKIQTIDPVGLEEGVSQSTREADYQLPKLNKIKPPENLVAGRIKHFYLNWVMMTTDPKILETVKGYKIPFVCQPPRQWRKRHTKAKSKVDTSSIKEAIYQLQLQGAIKIVHEQPNQFTSTLFVVKQASKARPIFNFKNLNRYVQPCKFKMEGLDTVRKFIQPGDFMIKLDTSR